MMTVCYVLVRGQDRTHSSLNHLSQLLLASLLPLARARCLGAGRGSGSCPAPPFRAPPSEVQHLHGCPPWAQCCTEYGFCHSKVLVCFCFNLYFTGYRRFFNTNVFLLTSWQSQKTKIFKLIPQSPVLFRVTGWRGSSETATARVTASSSPMMCSGRRATARTQAPRAQTRH